MRSVLLSIHILAIIAWLGGGFYELWLGRKFLRMDGSAAEAPLARSIYQSDLAVFGATLIAFATGATMSIVLEWGFFTHLWLGLKQAMALLILVIVAMIFPAAMKLGQQIASLPSGDGPVPAELKETYRRLEPWYAFMRILGTIGVILAVWRPD